MILCLLTGISRPDACMISALYSGGGPSPVRADWAIQTSMICPKGVDSSTAGSRDAKVPGDLEDPSATCAPRSLQNQIPKNWLSVS